MNIMTMNKIHLLDEATINKIAAGEVIERPASVIKELLENSIDAGATDIRVEVIGGGTRSIRVTDNGSGMNRDDVSLAFLKHATSKITDATDIESVMTLGFRGEALSSITAVAKVEIVTKREGDLEGTRLVVHGGEVVSIGDAGTPKGTSVIVEDLFYNTPARRKFLKKGRTELANIVEVVTRNALGHDHISFYLSHDDRELFRSPSSGDLFDTIVHIYGPEIARELIAVDFSNNLIRISGFISRPGFTRGDKDYQAFFINGRSVRSKSISDAIKLGYYTMLPKGRYPVAILNFTLDTSEVDVNVHPTKQHVRFSHELALVDAVAEAIGFALAQQELLQDKEHNGTQTRLSTDRIDVPVIRETQTGFQVPVKDTQRRLKHTDRYLAQVSGESELPFDIEILGQVDNTYIVARTLNGLILIDQHAAHERVLYEQVSESGIKGSQELITPINLQLSSKERVLIKEYMPHLEESGFGIIEFGPDSFAVRAVPNILGRLEDPLVVHDIISDILSGGRVKDMTGISEWVRNSTACRGAIKAGAKLTPEQMKNLVFQLYRTRKPYTCPHGRPTVVTFSRQDLDKLFKRI
ncbi:MAG: DNA mismatch repair endonuclease MutL [Methanosarcinales archaeon]|nr:DNA mismatch repair endonuclease MutL [Methanosarcinales archaeon]